MIAQVLILDRYVVERSLISPILALKSHFPDLRRIVGLFDRECCRSVYLSCQANKANFSKTIRLSGFSQKYFFVENQLVTPTELLRTR